MKSIKIVVLALIILLPAAKVYASASSSAKAAAYKTTGTAKGRADTASAVIVAAAASAGQKTKRDAENTSHETQAFDLNSFIVMMPTVLLTIIFGYAREYDLMQIAHSFNLGGEFPCLAVLPDQRLASVGSQNYQGNIKIWHIADSFAALIKTFVHGAMVQHLTALSTGRLISGGFGGKSKIWDLTNNSCDPIQTLDNEGYIASSAVLSDGRLAFGGSAAKIKILDPTNDSSVPTYLDNEHWIRSVAVLSQGKLAVHGGDSSVKICDSHLASFAYRVPDVSCFAELLDGRLALGRHNGMISIYDLKNPLKPIRELHHGRWPICFLAVLPDERLASADNHDGVGAIKIWNNVDNPLDHKILLHGEDITCLAVLSDGRLVSGGRSGIAKVWGKEASNELEAAMAADILAKKADQAKQAQEVKEKNQKEMNKLSQNFVLHDKSKAQKKQTSAIQTAIAARYIQPKKKSTRPKWKI